MKILFMNFDIVELLSLPTYELINAKRVLQTVMAVRTEHVDFQSILPEK